MRTETIAEGPTIEEAVDTGLDELGVQADAAHFEVIEDEGGGPEGNVRVRLWLKSEFIAQMEQGADADEDEDADVGQEEIAPDVETELPELTEEELDEIADVAVAAIQAILKGMGIEATVDEYEGDEREIILDIVGADLAVLIGRHGRTLDALQVIVSAITGRTIGKRYPVVVDVEGYRGRRRERLEEVARRTADRVSKQGRPVQLRPMNSFERRVVHVALRDDRRVVTGSEGEEPFRQVVVSPR